ncbi:hypothetical protein [Nonomuraea angiospora]|uniref:hypothetical protein n=1 Tax=Nonomuraea angiospora TaxID=46172 RepID=UPI0029ABC30A|nr:hypothetical protein [Nonomuraea angiospora]MDX3104276.1 hypothetical protein [Nonomuraea angiospora]
MAATLAITSDNSADVLRASSSEVVLDPHPHRPVGLECGELAAGAFIGLRGIHCPLSVRRIMRMTSAEETGLRPTSEDWLSTAIHNGRPPALLWPDALPGTPDPCLT